MDEARLPTFSTPYVKAVPGGGADRAMRASASGPLQQ